MQEESVEGFIARWSNYAAAVSIFSRVEGSPLLELYVGGAIIQIFERTNPYLSRPGDARMILNPTAARTEPSQPGLRQIESTGPARIRARGLVIERQEPMLVVDSGVTLVVGGEEAFASCREGDWIVFESSAPVHGFILPLPRAATDARPPAASQR